MKISKTFTPNLAVFATLFFALISNQAQAIVPNFYVGVDGIFADSNHQIKNLSSSSNNVNKDEKNDEKMNFGVNAGLRFDLLGLYASGEIFYDNLQTQAKNFRLVSGNANDVGSTNIDNRYGAKANVGFGIFPRTTLFLTYGLTNIRYGNNSSSSNNSLSKDKLTPLYGAGILVDLPLDFSVKASYDYQNFTMKYADSSAKVRTYLSVFKLGLIYNF